MIFRGPFPDLQFPETPAHAYVSKGWPELGDRPALIDGPSGRTITYHQLSDMVSKAAAGFADLGMKKGDRFAIFAPNMPEYAVVFSAVSLAGGINTTINPLYTIDELTYQLNDTGARFLLTVPPFLDKAIASAKDTDIESILVLGEAEGAVPFASLMTTDTDPPTLEFSPRGDLIAILYSSGTTGMPKGVMLTHFNLVATLEQWVVAVPSEKHEVTVAVAPFFHCLGLVGLCSDLSRGCTVITMPRFDLELYLQLIERHGATFLRTAPPIIHALAEHPSVSNFNLSTVEDIWSGAAPLSKSLAVRCAKRVGCDVKQACGMTESTASAYIAPRGVPMKYPTSVGPCLPNTETKIIDLSSGEELGHGEQGEILIRGPQVMKGYWNNAEATASTIDTEGWLHTGDVGYVNEDGYVFIVDRIKELIKYKGHQIAPVELESVLQMHPDVLDAAVIPIADEPAGQIPKAFVVRKNENANAEDILAFAAQHLAPHKKIRQLEFVEEIPRSVSGKILRRVLIERHSRSKKDTA